jgi:manganese efflux pump family protein
LGLTGIYTIFSAVRESKDAAATRTSTGTGRLLATGLALSADNLVIGFALGTYHVSVAVAAALIAAVSVALSLVGLELGSRLGEHLGQRSEVLGGAIRIAVGAAIATRVI